MWKVTQASQHTLPAFKLASLAGCVRKQWHENDLARVKSLRSIARNKQRRPSQTWSKGFTWKRNMYRQSEMLASSISPRACYAAHRLPWTRVQSLARERALRRHFCTWRFHNVKRNKKKRERDKGYKLRTVKALYQNRTLPNSEILRDICFRYFIHI